MLKVFSGVERKPIATFRYTDDATEWARAQSRTCSITYSVKDKDGALLARFFRGEEVPED